MTFLTPGVWDTWLCNSQCSKRSQGRHGNISFAVKSQCVPKNISHFACELHKKFSVTFNATSTSNKQPKHPQRNLVIIQVKCVKIQGHFKVSDNLKDFSKSTQKNQEVLKGWVNPV